MRYRGLIGGLFWLGIGLLLSFWAVRYELGGVVQPGPGFFPFLLGLLLILLSLLSLFGKVKRISVRDPTISPSLPGGWKKVVYAVVILTLAALFFEKVGYLITFFLLILLSMRGAGPQSWKRILLVALLTTLGVYLVFILLLGQPMPPGFLRGLRI